MSELYHIGPKGPGKCSASKGKCPFGGLENHFTSHAAAEMAFEKSNEAKAHSTLTKKRKFERPSDALKELRSDFSRYGAMRPLQHDLLMQYSSEEWNASVKELEKTYSSKANARDWYDLAAEIRANENSYGELRAQRGKITPAAEKRSPEKKAEAERLDKEMSRVWGVINTLTERERNVNLFDYEKEVYQYARAAQRIMSPGRIVDGITLEPGEAVSRGLYSTNGDYIGLIRFNMRGNTPFFAESNDGTRTAFNMPSGNAEKRFNELKADGYVIGPVVVPGAIALENQGRAKGVRVVTASPRNLKAIPPKSVDNFPHDANSWAATVQSAKALY